MTNQELFDKVVRGIRMQGRPSMDEDNRCCYRGLDGAKCAAGLLIPDEKYDHRMERKNVEAVREEFGGDVFEFTAEQLPLVRALQLAHDSAAHLSPEERLGFVRLFRESAIVIAAAMGLNDDACCFCW